MKKILTILLIIFFVFPLMFGFGAYITYKPTEYCKKLEILERMQEESYKKLGMDWYEFDRLPSSKQLLLMKKDTDYLQLEAMKDLAYDLKMKCIKYIGVDKLSRFTIDITTGEYFK